MTTRGFPFRNHLHCFDIGSLTNENIYRANANRSESHAFTRDTRVLQIRVPANLGHVSALFESTMRQKTADRTGPQAAPWVVVLPLISVTFFPCALLLFLVYITNGNALQMAMH